MENVQKPKALRPGQTIGLLAPSSGLPKPEKLPVAIQYLEALGYRVKTMESCTSRYGYLAGPDALRAEDINCLFRDDTVDAILCVRGGYGATRLLGALDYDAIRANPKVFSGYSDITALHGAFLRRANLVTFHGMMAVPDFGGEKVDPFSADCFWRMVGRAEPYGPLDNPPDYPREAIAPGRAEGMLIGGNLSLLASCLGTPYAPSYEGAILFIEEINEKTYAVDRMLTQLKNAGVLNQCAAILLGEFTDCGSERDHDLTLRQVFDDILAPLGIPVLSGIRCGHCTPNLTLPFGIRCTVDATAGTVEIVESAVG